MKRAAGLAGRVILVVEDDWFVADDIAGALSRDGARVAGPVASPGDALDLIRDSRVDLAVLDVRLMEANVEPVADDLTARGVPFVFATGYARADLPPRFADAPLWEKPFDTQRLARFLATMPLGPPALRAVPPPNAGEP